MEASADLIIFEVYVFLLRWIWSILVTINGGALIPLHLIFSVGILSLDELGLLTTMNIGEEAGRLV